ncbi:MAG TPA: hypothetical protein VGR98_12220 [Streptosporangiaceae bacterium]|nr:hypothetical protein [Streptosporangiaceae bacterium]
MSMQTTLAAAAAAAARRAWDEHLLGCPQCSAARGGRGRRRTFCLDGGMARAAVLAADNQLAYERLADRRPARGQQALDGLEPPGQLELFGDVLP